MYPACLLDLSEDENYSFFVELASTLKNNSHPHRRLTDLLNTFLESSDNAKQN